MQVEGGSVNFRLAHKEADLKRKLDELKSLGANSGSDCIRCQKKVSKEGRCECPGCTDRRNAVVSAPAGHHVNDAGARAADGAGGASSAGTLAAQPTSMTGACCV